MLSNDNSGLMPQGSSDSHHITLIIQEACMKILSPTNVHACRNVTRMVIIVKHVKSKLPFFKV